MDLTKPNEIRKALLKLTDKRIDNPMPLLSVLDTLGIEKTEDNAWTVNREIAWLLAHGYVDAVAGGGSPVTHRLGEITPAGRDYLATLAM